MSQEQAKEYEIIYFISVTLEEDDIKKIKNKVNAILNKHQATIIKEDSLGKHKLAYIIKQARHGYFLLITFTAPANEIATISHELKLMPEILRYKLAIKQKNTTAAAQSRIKPETPLKPSSTTESSENITPERKNAKPKEPKEKVDIQELDRKIDELLSDDNV